MKFTQNQDRAIHARGGDLLVSASAGSGKTTVMIERIAKMIQSGEVALSEILVLTFTKASASDMRAKLRRKLGQAYQDDIATVAMGNFHKYCSDLVRTYFNVVGVDPAFDVLDDIEGMRIKGEILDKIISKNYERCSLAIDTFCANRSTKALKDELIRIAAFLETREDAEEWLDSIATISYQALDKNKAFLSLVHHYNQMGEYYLKCFSEFSQTPFVNHVVGLATQLCDVRTYDDLYKFQFAPPFERLKKGKDEDDDDYAEFKKLRTTFKKEVTKIGEYFMVPLKEAVKRQTYDKIIIEQTIHLLREFLAVYKERKASGGKLDFADMEKFALKILAEPEIAKSLGGRFKHIFVDEYQDTNPVQEQILTRLAGDGANTPLFLVGDIKQSIYGFRGCEAVFFANKLNTFENSSNGNVIALNENFRSRPRILEFVNSIFGKIMTQGVASIDYGVTSKFVPGKVDKQTDKTAVEVIIINTKKDKDAEEPEPPDDADAITKQSAIIAQKIDELSKIYSLGDIAVLARTKRHLGTLAEVLNRAGIQTTTMGDVVAHDLFEIALLENFLFAVSNYHNDLPLVLTMKSMAFNFSADDLARISVYAHGIALKTPATHALNFYEKMRHYMANHYDELSKRLEKFCLALEEFSSFARMNNVTDTFTKFLTQFMVIEKLLVTPTGENMVQNIRRYLNALRGASFAETVSGYLYLLENELLEIKIGGGGSTTPSVNLMTIHNAKGLEYPAVILFDIGTAFSSIDTRNLIVTCRDLGLTVHSTDLESHTKSMSIARLGSQVMARRTQVAEEMRLFYVALTRAQERLVIVGATSNAEGDIASASEFEILSSRNYIDFLRPTIFGKQDGFDLQVINLTDIKIVAKKDVQKTISGKADTQLVKELKKIYVRETEGIAGANVVLKHSVTSLTKREMQVADVEFTTKYSKDRGIDYGTRFHDTMQRIDWEKGTHDDKNVTKCLETLRPFLSGMNVMREVPFLKAQKHNGAQVIVQGIIDLLAISDNRAVLVDYKTTRADETKLKELYSEQLMMYAGAVKETIGIDVEVYIYSTSLGKLIRV